MAVAKNRIVAYLYKGDKEIFEKDCEDEGTNPSREIREYVRRRVKRNKKRRAKCVTQQTATNQG